MIDCHWHTMLAAASLDDYNQSDDELIVAIAINKAKANAAFTVLQAFEIWLEVFLG